MTIPIINQTRFLSAISFAADKHRFQTRKDPERTPYINHPIKVALTLADIGGVTDEDLLIAAILHDTIEDTETSPAEIKELFGQTVLDLVMEVTDDKRLTKEERKRLQVAHASSKSPAARQLKMADKICNVTDIIYHPPSGWTQERKLNYLDWAEAVLNGLRGTNHALEERMDEVINEGRRLILVESSTFNVQS